MQLRCECIEVLITQRGRCKQWWAIEVLSQNAIIDKNIRLAHFLPAPAAKPKVGGLKQANALATQP